MFPNSLTSFEQTVHPFSPWTLQVDLLLRQGPTGLHLTDLRDVELVYKRPKAVTEKDKNGSRPARSLAPVEEKAATSSRSHGLESDDMEADDTITDGPSMNASRSGSSPGTAAASKAATPRLRRSARLAPAV